MRYSKKAIMAILVIIMVFAMTTVAFAGTGSRLSASEVKATKPQNVVASSYNYSKIKVTWDKIPGVDGYVIYRATSKDGKYTKAFTTKADDKTWYINTNRTSGKTYWYKVRGYKKINGKTYYTKYSAPDSAFARPNKVKVTSITATNGWDDYFHLKWNEVKGATGYQIFMKETGEKKYTFMGNYKGTKADVMFETEAKTYDLKVRAYRTVNGTKVYGLFSNVVNYEFDWTPEMAKAYAEEFYLKTYPGFTIKDGYSDGSPKTPYNTSWSAIWPRRVCFYEPWEDVKAEIEEAILTDMEVYGEPLNYQCFYLDYEGASPNWMHLYMIG